MERNRIFDKHIHWRYNVGMKKININIDEKILKKLKQQAKEEGRTVTDLIRQAIVGLLKEKAKK